jgi:hypothetical protein
VESDHGTNDPPAAIPSRIEWVEFLVAQQFKIHVKEVRQIVWQNLARIVRRTGTRQLWPEAFAAVFSEGEASDGE